MTMMRTKNHLLELILLGLLLLSPLLACDHDLLADNNMDLVKDAMKRRTLNVGNGNRNLQAAKPSNLRFYTDYSLVQSSDDQTIKTIKLLVGVATAYFSKVLTVMPIDNLLFPATSSLECVKGGDNSPALTSVTIPSKYVIQGVSADLGLIITSANSTSSVVAQGVYCALNAVDNRPIWGAIIYNFGGFLYDQEGFQQNFLGSLHQLTHILGFSASLFQVWPTGNPVISKTAADGTTQYFVNTPKINDMIKSYFKCSNPNGLALQDQDVSTISSHWEKKLMFNEYMTAMQNLNGYVSNFTLAALESSGWYSSVDYSWSEPSTYGRGKGCEFMRIDNCDFEEYCQDANSYGCVWAGTGEGQCLLDDFTDNCQIYVYFTNTVCISENFLSTNLNINANALEVGGYNSRCFLSDFHVPDITPTNLKSRCYVTRCALNSKYIYIVLTKKTVLVCTQPGMVINAPKSLGLTGQLTCPTNFSNYCQGKNTCLYSCNMNGLCINGFCLCSGSTVLTSTCLDPSKIEDKGATGSLHSRIHTMGALGGPKQCKQNGKVKCLSCSAVFNCAKCTNQGCIVCDNGSLPADNGKTCT